MALGHDTTVSDARRPPTTARPGPRALTVLHAAERTGPPLFALQFLRWQREHHPDWRGTTLFLDAGGPLVEAFAELGPVVLADGRVPYRAPADGLRGRTARRRQADLRRELSSHGTVDVCHVHCAGSFRALGAVPASRVLGHVHEMHVGLELHLGPEARRHLATADRYVAVSPSARRAFLAHTSVEPSLVEVQPGFVDERRLEAPPRATLGLSDDVFLVLASGVRHWRKAPELFVRAAQVAADLAPEVTWQFVWVGGEDVGGLESLVDRAGLGELVLFRSHQPEVLPWIACADLFALPAREDAFPLVCVEAAAAGTPIVTFENGGAADLVRDASCGAVAPALEVDAFARALVDAARDPDRRAAWADSGRAHARRHLLLSVAGPKLQAVLDVLAAAS